MSKQDLKYIIDSITNNQVSELDNSDNVRNACVAAIIRWRPYIIDHIIHSSIPPSPNDFLNQPWVNDCHGEAEILYIRRALHPGDIWSGHIAFPGGKNEPSDKNHLDTVIRECKEEIGLDLASPEFIALGTLQHRVLTALKTKKPTMILVPHIFLQVTPVTPELTIQVSEVAEAFWTPIRYLLQDPIVAYNPLVDAVIKPGAKIPWPEATRVAAVPLKTPKGKEIHLWGMTLRMTQEILGMQISPHTVMSPQELEDFERKQKARL